MTIEELNQEREKLVGIIEQYVKFEPSNEICICLGEVVRIIKTKDHLLYEEKQSGHGPEAKESEEVKT